MLKQAFGLDRTHKIARIYIGIVFFYLGNMNMSRHYSSGLLNVFSRHLTRRNLFTTSSSSSLFTTISALPLSPIHNRFPSGLLNTTNPQRNYRPGPNLHPSVVNPFVSNNSGPRNEDRKVLVINTGGTLGMTRVGSTNQLEPKQGYLTEQLEKILQIQEGMPHVDSDVTEYNAKNVNAHKGTLEAFL